MRQMVIALSIITCLIVTVNISTFAQAGVWVKKKDMPTSRYGMASVVVDGNIYVIGGWGNNEFLTAVEMYDTESDI